MRIALQSLILPALLATTFFGGLIAGVEASAKSRAEESGCIAKLSRGQNRMNAKIPADALKKLARGMQQRATQLQGDEVGLLVDYTKNSKVKRAFLVDFKSCDVLSADYAMHGGAYYDKKKKPQFDGDPNNDGMLDRCKNKIGTRSNMTRPGLYMTTGCHVNSKKRWTKLDGRCTGVKLAGLESSNSDAAASGVVLHELIDVKEDGKIKPLGQGCPAFAKGRLKKLLRYGLMEKTMVLVHAPQCR